MYIKINYCFESLMLWLPVVASERIYDEEKNVPKSSRCRLEPSFIASRLSQVVTIFHS